MTRYHFGLYVSNIGDLDGDGVIDLVASAVLDDDGGTDRGAVWILFLNTNGTVKAQQKISALAGGFTGGLDDFDFFGYGLPGLGDLDQDGVNDIAVGAQGDDDGGTDRGAIYVLFLNSNGTIKKSQKISALVGGYDCPIYDNDVFGTDIAVFNDLDGDGIIDLAVATREDDGGIDRGAVAILYLNQNGTVRTQKKISNTQGCFTGILDNVDFFGNDVAVIGDLNGDGIEDMTSAAPLDDDGGLDRGAVYVLFMNNLVTPPCRADITPSGGNGTVNIDDLVAVLNAFGPCP